MLYTGTSDGQRLSSVTGGGISLNVRYDAATQRYTLAIPGGVETTLGTPVATNRLYDTYRGNDATAANDVQMIRVGATSLAETRYVGGGTWLRRSGPPTALFTQPLSFTFGVATPASDVPLTGSASFAVVLNALGGSGSSITDYTGSGLLSADFGTGRWMVSGTTTSRIAFSGAVPAIVYNPFSGSGSISGGVRSLAGRIDLGFPGQTNNEVVSGRFFGPGAAEVGAVFGDRSLASDSFVAGTLIGRRGTTAPVVETLSSLISTGSLPYDQFSLRVDTSGQGLGLPPSVEFNGGIESRVTLDPGAQTFDFENGFPIGPSDRVAAESVGRFTAYRRTNVSTPITYRIYNQGSGNTELPLDFVSFALTDRFGLSAVPFGFRSSPSFIPLAGRATFDGVFYGDALSAGSINRYGLRGLATLTADFGALTIGGSFTAAATFQGTTTDLGRFTLANGRIGQLNPSIPSARPDNLFSADISGTPGTIGSVFGSFYGPAVQELGATVRLVTPGPGVTLLGQGVIVAKRGAVDSTPAPPSPPAPTPLANTSLDALTQSDTFVATAQRASAVYPGNGTSPAQAAAVPLTVRYDAATQSYTVTEGSASTTFAPGDRVTSNRLADTFRTTGSSGTDTVRLTPTGTRSVVGTRYVAGGIWSRDTAAGGIRSLLMRSFVFGIPSAISDIPTTGTASFGVVLNGVQPISQTSTPPDLSQVNGSGLLSINWATGTVTGNGALYIRSAAIPSAAPLLGPGSFDYTGSIANGQVRGFLTLRDAGGSGPSGPANGALYGPGAGEIGLSYSVSSGTSIRSGVGVITGTRATAAPAFETLTSLLSDVSLGGFEATLNISAPGSGTSVQTPIQLRPVEVGAGYDRFNINGAFAPGDAIPADSNARFTTFRKTDSSGVATVRVYRAGSGNTELALSYASLAVRDFVPATAGGARVTSTHAFGLPTLASFLPRTGTGTYTGVAYGTGYVPGAQNDAYALSGTTSMTFDWAASTFGGSMALSVRNERTSANEALGNIAFGSGTLNPGAVAFTSTLTGVSGTSGDLRGSFFGPLAQELGAAFLLTTPISAGTLQAQGAIVAKKN